MARKLAVFAETPPRPPQKRGKEKGSKIPYRRVTPILIKNPLARIVQHHDRIRIIFGPNTRARPPHSRQGLATWMIRTEATGVPIADQEGRLDWVQAIEEAGDFGFGDDGGVIVGDQRQELLLVDASGDLDARDKAGAFLDRFGDGVHGLGTELITRDERICGWRFWK